MEEIIMNDEVIEVAEDMVTSGSRSGWKIAGGVGLLALAGFGLYKGGKWIARKIKAKKEQKELASDAEITEE